MAEEEPVERSRGERDVRASRGVGMRYVGGIQVPSTGWRLGQVLRSLYASRERQNADEIIRGRTRNSTPTQLRITDLLLLGKLKIHSSVLKEA